MCRKTAKESTLSSPERRGEEELKSPENENRDPADSDLAEDGDRGSEGFKLFFLNLPKLLAVFNFVLGFNSIFWFSEYSSELILPPMAPAEHAAPILQLDLRRERTCGHKEEKDEEEEEGR